MFSGFDSQAPLLPEILALHGKWHSEREAVVCDDTRLTWSEFCQGNHQLAHGLIARGIQPKDRVGIVMSNGIPMLQAIMAVMAVGATVVPINLSVPDVAIVGMMKDAGVIALIATQDQQARIDQLRSDMPPSLTLYISDVTADRHWHSLADLMTKQPGTLPIIDIAADDPVNIIYSSGTTGLPKGIVHSHRGRRDWAYDLCIALRYHGCAKTLITIGLYSNISWVAMLCTLLSGGTLFIHKNFNASAFLATVEREQISHTAMVPIQFQRIVEQFKTTTADLSSMQGMMSCGSPLHADLKQSIFETFGCGIVELYGLTEGIITTLDPEYADGRWASVGKPLLGTDIAIIDEDNNPLNQGQAGEIVSRGRITMSGYLNRETANEEACYYDSEGKQWLRSGDIGYLDPQGYLFIVDRKKDMILSGGQNIFPQDIEAILVQHPAINDVAVIGANSVRWGETPIALVVPETGGLETEANFLAWANQRLGKQQRLTEIIFVELLPRNPNGKILKRELRQQYGVKIYD
jgi:acyl-CoA synthetase (AMP-forming)/AMP-acid ligase II